MDRVRRWAWGLSGRLIASYILVTIAVVVLVEALVLCFQVAPLAVRDQRQAQLQDRVDATAKSYAQYLPERYPGGVPAGTVLGDPSQPGWPGQATPAFGGTTLAVPAVTGPVRRHQEVTAVVALAADGRVVTSSAPSRYPPGRAASELPVQAAMAIAGGPARIKGGSVPTPYGRVLFWVARPEGLADTSKPMASAPGRVAYVYVQVPWSPPWFINPVSAWRDLSQLGQLSAVASGPAALVLVIVPLGVLFGPSHVMPFGHP